MDSSTLFPLALKLFGRDVLVVGGGLTARDKVRSLLAAGARVTVVAPEIAFDLGHERLQFRRRPFRSSDVENAWLVVAAATPQVNRQVAAAASMRHRFAVVVDDACSSTAYGMAILRRGDVTLAISTSGQAPALAALLREALERCLPERLDTWARAAARLRPEWRQRRVPLGERRPLLLRALNRIYDESPEESAS